jgi:hypothetical protein
VWRRLRRWLRDARWWLDHRSLSRYHVVKTGLKPGYYDVDYRMLHACFNLLVYYVEHECAWRWTWCHPERRKGLGPWWRRRFGSVRNPAYGIASLKEESELRYGPEYRGLCGKLLPQAEAAAEALELYKWWVEERPRLDENAGETLAVDETMLIRLMRIRPSLWT